MRVLACDTKLSKTAIRVTTHAPNIFGCNVVLGLSAGHWHGSQLSNRFGRIHLCLRLRIQRRPRSRSLGGSSRSRASARRKRGGIIGVVSQLAHEFLHGTHRVHSRKLITGRFVFTAAASALPSDGQRRGEHILSVRSVRRIRVPCYTEGVSPVRIGGLRTSRGMRILLPEMPRRVSWPSVGSQQEG